jgi:dTDP-4-dehydrorhamnose 3,5-epimerase
MHYQVAPFPEAKLVRCTRGALFDVIIDLRPDSPTFKKWVSVELTSQNHRSIFIPEGFAHGFQSLSDATEVFYQMTENYHAECSRGVRWNDVAFGIDWPFPPLVISDQDNAYLDFLE